MLNCTLVALNFCAHNLIPSVHALHYDQAHHALPPSSSPPSVPPSISAKDDNNANTTVNSPMVGTAYLAPAPGADSFVTVGSFVVKGQTLLVVEAMKTMNPIIATIDGTIKAVLVANAAPVEYGQPLVVIG